MPYRSYMGASLMDHLRHYSSRGTTAPRSAEARPTPSETGKAARAATVQEGGAGSRGRSKGQRRDPTTRRVPGQGEAGESRHGARPTDAEKRQQQRETRGGRFPKHHEPKHAPAPQRSEPRQPSQECHTTATGESQAIHFFFVSENHLFAHHNLHHQEVASNQLVAYVSNSDPELSRSNCSEWSSDIDTTDSVLIGAQSTLPKSGHNRTLSYAAFLRSVETTNVISKEPTVTPVLYMLRAMLPASWRKRPFANAPDRKIPVVLVSGHATVAAFVASSPLPGFDTSTAEWSPARFEFQKSPHGSTT